MPYLYQVDINNAFDSVLLQNSNGMLTCSGTFDNVSLYNSEAGLPNCYIL